MGFCDVVNKHPQYVKLCTILSHFIFASAEAEQVNGALRCKQSARGKLDKIQIETEPRLRFSPGFPHAQLRVYLVMNLVVL